jgi:hypothetical protein
MKSKNIRLGLLLSLTFLVTAGALADPHEWEYQVVILQGIAAGGTIKKQSSGIYIDTRKTEALNTLAADGWEIVGVVGATGADHTVYLRRRRG